MFFSFSFSFISVFTCAFLSFQASPFRLDKKEKKRRANPESSEISRLTRAWLRAPTTHHPPRLTRCGTAYPGIATSSFRNIECSLSSSLISICMLSHFHMCSSLILSDVCLIADVFKMEAQIAVPFFPAPQQGRRGTYRGGKSSTSLCTSCKMSPSAKLASLNCFQCSRLEKKHLPESRYFPEATSTQ